MEISPLRMAQVIAGQDGRRYEVSGDAAGLVADICDLDPTLRVAYNEGGDFFVVYQLLNEHRLPDVNGHTESVVLRVQAAEWDRRVLGYMQLRGFELRHGKSVNDRLDQQAKDREAAREKQLEDAVAEWAPRAFHAMQKDMGMKPRIFVPERSAA